MVWKCEKGLLPNTKPFPAKRSQTLPKSQKSRGLECGQEKIPSKKWSTVTAVKEAMVMEHGVKSPSLQQRSRGLTIRNGLELPPNFATILKKLWTPPDPWSFLKCLRGVLWFVFFVLSYMLTIILAYLLTIIPAC